MSAAEGSAEPTSRAERIAALGFRYDLEDKQRVPNCNLCGSSAWVSLAQTDRYGYPVSAEACGRCGLTVLNPRMTHDAYRRFYRGVYRPLVSAYHGRTIDAQTVQHEQQVYARTIEPFVARHLSSQAPRTLLDVGGSTGVVASHLARRFGLAATVVDPALDEIAEARLRGLETIVGLIEDWEPRSRQFGTIGMFQTIDHLQDVMATLHKIRAVIAENGVFIVDIVDFRAEYLRNRSLEAALKIDHPYSLIEDTVEAFFARSGFEVIEKVHAEDGVHVVYACSPGLPSPGACPAPAAVTRFLREARSVANPI